MTYQVDRTAEEVIFPIRIVSDSGSPIESLAYDTPGLSADFMVAGAVAWSPITLATATLGVWTSGGFVEKAGGDGWYELGVPAAGIVAGKVTDFRVKTTGNQYRYGSVSATATNANDIAAIMQAYDISLVSPVDASGVLTLVQRADYTADSAGGPLRFVLNQPGIVAGDAIRFGATHPLDEAIQATGTVVDIDGTLYGQIELNKETHTNRVKTSRACYELEHVSAGGKISTLIADRRLVILSSHAEA